MRSTLKALPVELFKILKSRIFWVVLFLFVFIPLMLSLLMFVQKYPGLAQKLGMIGTKANLLRFGEPDWNNYLKLLGEANAAISMIAYGFLTAWIFGREYTDRTLKDLLALPVSRSGILNAKFISVLAWSIFLAIVFLITALFAGKAIQLTGWSETVIIAGIKTYTFTFFLTILLCTPVGFLASYGRGLLLPLGFIILTLIIANFTGLIGLGPYFPWAIPGMYSVSGGTGEMSPQPVSYLILFITSVAGYVATWAWWKYADHT
jgi:ABC-type transport system involved in multi-copper enzyme maturation permease subunit